MESFSTHFLLHQNDAVLDSKLILLWIENSIWNKIIPIKHEMNTKSSLRSNYIITSLKKHINSKCMECTSSCNVLRVSTRIFNFSRYGRSPMCGLLRPRMNEGLKVKEVNVIWMNTWGILNRTNNMTRSWFSPFLYICIILTFFYFKKKAQL